MKHLKHILTAMVLMGTAQAGTTSFNLTVSTAVQNECIFTNSVFSSNLGFTTLTTGTVHLNYKATSTSSGSATVYIKCTAGSALTLTPPAGLVLIGSELQVSASGSYTSTASNHTSGSADQHTLTLNVTAAAGQWNVNAGTHNGTVVFGVSYL
ncbi:hypothetical protein [Deinococcus cellulosilyticus]|uniref:Uncharacterized protein n=1 Tax=Deinococcus cellulosilyticus (strain DSM 18568 / NBRC 106333 / KACC 11606 / 5516J-15) TaxID=1223518 RepID=A0A511N7U1_DEIC1|nr:hypothetical protein [Deinococcus cellulosilyticus]GEM48536.1 hypothetical protein DC3_41710 [Deinococcus cellulosilyticus NBRC 106333 = KACC 11606]